MHVRVLLELVDLSDLVPISHIHGLVDLRWRFAPRLLFDLTLLWWLLLRISAYTQLTFLLNAIRSWIEAWGSDGGYPDCSLDVGWL